MKIAKQIPAYLLAFVFVVFGSNHFLNFMPMPPMSGDPATYMSVMGPTGYMTTIKICEVVFGLLLIFPKTRALGLLLIAPIVVNILLFELHIAKAPGIGVVLVLLVALGIYFNKEKYSSILA
jgi:putative oxidoreductase